MKNKRIISALLTVLLIPFVLFAQPAMETNDPAEETFLFTDDLGREVTLPVEIERVLPSGLLSQYILFPVAAEKMVANSLPWCDEASDYIPENYLSKPYTGQIYGKHSSFNLEEVLSLNPQVIIDTGEQKKGMKENLDSLQEQCNIPIIHIDATTATMGCAYRKIGKLLDCEDQAEEIARFCEHIYNRGVDFAQDGLDSGLYILGAKGVNVMAEQSFQSEIVNMLIDNAAVLNKFNGSGNGNEVDMEQILNWNPECLIFAYDAREVYRKVNEDPVWSKMEAVKNNRVYLAPATLLNWIAAPPSVNRFLGLIWAPTVLYPERAGWDAKAEVKEYFRLFYHADLSDAQYEEITRQ